MSTQYRVDIACEGRLWSSMHIEHPWAKEALRDLLGVLRAQSRYSLSVHVAHGERRIGDSSPAGVRVIAREPLYEPLSPEQLQALLA